jgi:hypothetical protein
VRNGLVVDLQMAPGAVTALVSGSELYDVRVTVSPVAPPRWRAIRKSCAGAIDSVIELLQGHLSDAVMNQLCDQKTGLFPSPRDIAFECSCPDRASMCKHVAAVLYGIGARLDRQPELLFTLRQVDHGELIIDAGAGLAGTPALPASSKVLASDDLSAMFGIDIAMTDTPLEAPGPALDAAPATPEQPPGATVKVPLLKTTSAAARIRAQRPRSTAALKRALANRLRRRAAEIEREKNAKR